MCARYQERSDEEKDEDGDSSQKSVTDKSLPHGELRPHRLNAREIG